MDFEVELTGGAPWGFRIQGGREFHSPIRINFLKPGGKAGRSKELKVGDVVVQINNTSTQNMTHTQAEQAIKRAGSSLKLVVNRKEKPAAPEQPTPPVTEQKEEVKPAPVPPLPVDTVPGVLKVRKMSSTTNMEPSVPAKEKDPDWYKSMLRNFQSTEPTAKPKVPKVLSKASVYEQEVEKINQYNAERSRPLQRADSKSIAEGVRRSQSPGGPPPVAPKRNTSNGVVLARQSISSPDPIRRPPPPCRAFSPQAGKKGIGFKPGGYSLAAGVKGARNISEAPLMHVSNIDHHERVSSYDSVESNTSNASLGGKSSEMSTPRSNSPHQFVGPISTKPITAPYNSRVAPKHSLHIDSSSRDVPSYNSEEVAAMLRQSYTKRTESTLDDNTLDFIKEFKDSKVIPINRLRDNENTTEIDSKIPENKNITIATPAPTTTSAMPRDVTAPSRDVKAPSRDLRTEKSPARPAENKAKESEPPRYCKARYTFKAEGDRELGFKKKDIIRIRREIDANWIEGELNDCVGIFPRNYVEILDPEPPQSPQEVETTFESKKAPQGGVINPSGNGMGYVPSYQRDIASLPQLSRYKKEEEADKENRREIERQREEERKEQERKERERIEEERRKKEERERRLEEEKRRVIEQRAAEQRKREEERKLAEEKRCKEEQERKLEEERQRVREQRAAEQRRREEEKRRREEELEEQRRRQEEEEERLRIEGERFLKEEQARQRREEKERKRREDEERRREDLARKRREEDEERRRVQERMRREEEERIRLEEEERRRVEEENRIREEERRIKEEEARIRRENEEKKREEERRKRQEEEQARQEERLRRLEEERLREDQLAREEEERLLAEKRLREEERLKELERLHNQEMEEGRRLKEEAEERARVKEQNNINYRVSNSELGNEEDEGFEVKAIYSFKSTDDGELPFRKGAVITVTEVIDDNWYYGQLGAATGMFPSTYVVKVEAPDIPPPPASPAAQRIEDCLEDYPELRDDKRSSYLEVDNSAAAGNFDNRSAGDSDDSNFQDYELYIAQYSYQPLNDDELELQRGDVVEVIERCEDGWYVGTSQRTEQFGTFPGNYVLPYDE